MSLVNSILTFKYKSLFSLSFLQSLLRVHSNIHTKKLFHTANGSVRGEVGAICLLSFSLSLSLSLSPPWKCMKQPLQSILVLVSDEVLIFYYCSVTPQELGVPQRTDPEVGANSGDSK